MASALEAWIDPFFRDMAVVERPQVYTVGKGDPNDLVPLAGIGAAFASRFDRFKWYLPKEWKGQLPKGIAFEKRILDRLDTLEIAEIIPAGSLTHNIYDAIGIGLHHLGRFQRRRVFAR
jgi:hypothetical protein